MAWYQDVVRGLGTQNAPFGFGPDVSPSQGAVDPAYNAGMQMIGNVGMGMHASGEANPLRALGRSYLVAQQNAQEQNKNQFVAAQMMQAAEEKKQERAREQERQNMIEAQISQLPPKLQGLARIAPEKVFGNVIDQQFPDQQGVDAPEFGLAPVALADKNGKFVGWGQMSKAGGLYFNGKQVDGSGDVVPMAPFDSNQMKAAGTAAGKEMGGAAAAIPGAEIDTQAMNDRIDMIRDNPSLGNAIGYGNAIGDYFVSNDVLSIRAQLNELEGGAFLSAYSSLKGGGQITEIESAQAKQAMADMQTARKMSDVDKFKEALERFRGAVNRGMEKIRRQAGQYAPGGSPAASGGTQQRLKFNPATGELE